MADSFSLEQTLAYLQSLFDIGERAAGTQEECARALFFRKTMPTGLTTLITSTPIGIQIKSLKMTPKLKLLLSNWEREK